MINLELLEQKIKDSGLKKEFIAKKCGLSRNGFYKKINNQSDFTVREINILCEVLSINKLTEKASIFFAKEVNQNDNSR